MSRPRRRPGVESLEDYESSLGKNPERYLRSVIENAESHKLDLWVIVTEPELWEKDTDHRANTFLRENFRQILRLENWTGPKDMVILIYHLE